MVSVRQTSVIYKTTGTWRRGRSHLVEEIETHLFRGNTYDGLWQRWGSDSVMNQMFLSFQNSYVETLIPDMVVFGGEALKGG